MTRFATLVTTLVAAASMAACAPAGTEASPTGKDIPMADHAQAGGTCHAPATDDSLIGKSEQEATALLAGCLWRISERDGKALPGTMDYREERRNLGLQSGKVIWVRRG